MRLNEREIQLIIDQLSLRKDAYQEKNSFDCEKATKIAKVIDKFFDFQNTSKSRKVDGREIDALLVRIWRKKIKTTNK